MMERRNARLRKVRLNHGDSPYRAAVHAFFLAAGVIGMSLALYLTQHVYAVRQTLETERAHLQHPPAEYTGQKPLSRAEQAVKRGETAAVNAAMAELLLPWESMLSALEKIGMPQVRIIAVEPDARQRKLRVTAESDSLESMLEYIRALERQPMLEGTLLLTHEQYHDGRAMPVRFVAEATWVI